MVIYEHTHAYRFLDDTRRRRAPRSPTSRRTRDTNGASLIYYTMELLLSLVARYANLSSRATRDTKTIDRNGLNGIYMGDNAKGMFLL